MAKGPPALCCAEWQNHLVDGPNISLGLGLVSLGLALLVLSSSAPFLGSAMHLAVASVLVVSALVSSSASSSLVSEAPQEAGWCLPGSACCRAGTTGRSRVFFSKETDLIDSEQLVGGAI